jgi:hypothetical protein
MSHIAVVWELIARHEGEDFTLKRGDTLVYSLDGNALRHNRSSTRIYRSQFEKALEYVPLHGPGQLSRIVVGPSYVYAILMDPRIRLGDW